MFKTIEGATDSEIRVVIRFLNARNVLPFKIHNQILTDLVMNLTWGMVTMYLDVQ